MTEQATPPSPQQAGVPPLPSEGDQMSPSPYAAPQAPAPKQQSKAGGAVKRIIGTVVVFAVLSLGGLAYKYLSGAPETAKVGDCLSGQSAEALKTVDCADATAEHKVIGKVEDKTEAEFDANADAICEAYPTFENAYWEGTKGGSGYVLCLEPVKK